MKITHPLWRTFRSLKGNQRACVFTEPLWAIPNNLFIPFASIYMAAIGLNDAEIGMVASVGLAMQFLSTLFSGAIVDKYGRRRTMMIFGLISWSIPCVLWAGAQGYWYFILAIALNGLWRVIGNSFSCMIVENEDTDKLVNVFSIFNIIGLLAGFISPIIGLCIDRYNLVPTMRIIYGISILLMTVKFILQYWLARESAIGIRRMEECKEHSLFTLTFGDWNDFINVFRHTRLLLLVIPITLMSCFDITQATFWPLFVSSAYGVSAAMLSVFPFVKAITTILAFLFVTSHISMVRIKRPLLMGFGIHFLGLITLLLCIPFAKAATIAVFFSAICEAFALAVIVPLMESLMAVTIPEKERARANSLITSMMLLISIPVGAIAGQLSQHNRMFPLVLNLGLIIAEILMVMIITRNLNVETTETVL